MIQFEIVFLFLSVFFSSVIGHNMLPFLKGKFHIQQDITETFTNFFNWNNELEPRFINGIYARIFSGLEIIMCFIVLYKIYEFNNLIFNELVTNIISVFFGLFFGVLMFYSNKRKFK